LYIYSSFKTHTVTKKKTQHAVKRFHIFFLFLLHFFFFAFLRYDQSISIVIYCQKEMGKEFCLHVGAVALCTAGNEAEVKVGNVDFLFFSMSIFLILSG